MQKIVSAIGICFFILSSYAQSNLQYNQAILVGSTLVTVPAGKVWKVEGILAPRISVGYTTPIPDQTVMVNGNTISVQYNGFHSGYTYSAQTSIAYGSSFPWWLPAGTSLQAGVSVVYISVIEFNLLSP